MPGSITTWKPKDWEQHVQLLLKQRYAHPPGSYQHIPDNVGGDRGIEGFADDGTAYQCYAAQDWADSEELLTRQKNKITSDIGKFIKNESELLSLLGSVRIKIWNLVVPYWNDKALVEHGNEKAKLVAAKNLKHVGPTFRISILTEEDFAVENQMLANLNLHKFNVAAPSIDPVQLAAWMDGTTNIELVSNLRRKAAKLGQNKTDQERARFEARIVANYIGGNIVLGRLEREFPETHGRIIEYKGIREDGLEQENFLTALVPSEFFQKALADYREEILKVPGIGPSAAEIIAREAVADWLLRCPMDF